MALNTATSIVDMSMHVVILFFFSFNSNCVNCLRSTSELSSNIVIIAWSLSATTFCIPDDFPKRSSTRNPDPSSMIMLYQGVKGSRLRRRVQQHYADADRACTTSRNSYQ